ncbi:MAG: hypothetical protein WCK02_11500 [Bacteroidota bacterium]
MKFNFALLLILFLTLRIGYGQESSTHHSFGYGGYVPMGSNKNLIGDGLCVFYEYNLLNKQNSRMFFGLDYNCSIINKNYGFWKYNNSSYSDFNMNFLVPIGITKNIFISKNEDKIVRIGLSGGPAFVMQKGPESFTTSKKYTTFFVSASIADISSGIMGMKIVCDYQFNGIILFKIYVTADFNGKKK